MSGESAPLGDGILAELKNALWGDLTGDDVARWYRQELAFSSNSETQFGLRQRSGGPCGVLAAVQGYVLARLLFGVDLSEVRSRVEAAASGSASAPGAGGAAATPTVGGLPIADPEKALHPTADALFGALAHALAFVCWQAGSMATARIVLCEESALPLSPETPAAALTVFTFTDLEEATAFVFSIMPQFHSASGVVLLVYSLLLSRGLARVREDADEPTALVARFGHSTQELLNLLLTGEATSGIFDGVQSLGGEPMAADAGGAGGAAAAGGAAGGAAGDVLCLRGVARRPLIGYLSHMEAMRYGKVGDFLKAPLTPIWVVGSESHFSLLFGADARANEESPSAGAYRAFKKFDEHDNQFIPVDKLAPVLAELGLKERVGADDAAVLKVARELDTGNIGYVLWLDFWTFLSALKTGAAADGAVQSVRAAHGLGGSGGAGAGAGGAGKGTGGGSGAALVAGSAGTYTGPPLTVDALKTMLREAFEKHDELGAGFVRPSQLRAVVATALPRLPAGVTFTEAEVSGLASQLSEGQDPAQAIILWEDLLLKVDPTLRMIASATATAAAAAAAVAAAAPGAPARAPGGAAGGAGAPSPAAGAPSTTAGRPRSDSEYARQLQAEMDGGGSSGGMPVDHPPAAPPAGAAAAAAAGGASASAAGADSAAGGAGGPASGEKDKESEKDKEKDGMRVFKLWHYNGIEDGGRRPRCAELTVRQLESGLPPVAANEDAIAAAALAGLASAGPSVSGVGAGGAMATDDPELAAALAASMADLGPAGGAPRVDSDGLDEAAAAAAAAAPAAGAAVDAGRAGGAGGAAAGGAALDVDDPELAAALAMSLADAGGAGGASAGGAADAGSAGSAGGAPAGAAAASAPAPASGEGASAAAGAGAGGGAGAAAAVVSPRIVIVSAGPLENIIRTKWPGASVKCLAPPPSID